ncbi:MAG: hypothetical protein AAF961_08775, partial [Planctomycetota bacterium]
EATSSPRIDASARAQAGEPIAAARRTAIDSRDFHRPLDKERIWSWMEIASRCTMAEFELFLSPLEPHERQLLERIEALAAPIVNRLHFEDLRGVLKNGGLASLYRQQQADRHQLAHTTPRLENLLYGGFDCVFASVGPADGSPRYGDVVIRLHDSVRERGWATPFSGMHFLWAVRHQDARQMQQLLADRKKLPTPPAPLSLGFDDRLHFSHYVVTEKHWNRALAYQAMLVLRNLDESPTSDQVRLRYRKMLAAEDGDTFWRLFIPSRERDLTDSQTAERVPFGYLEGKFADDVSIDMFTAIEVPSDRLDEVRQWPEARPYLQLIRGRSDRTEAAR